MLNDNTMDGGGGVAGSNGSVVAEVEEEALELGVQQKKHHHHPQQQQDDDEGDDEATKRDQKEEDDVVFQDDPSPRKAQDDDKNNNNKEHNSSQDEESEETRPKVRIAAETSLTTTTRNPTSSSTESLTLSRSDNKGDYAARERLVRSSDGEKEQQEQHKKVPLLDKNENRTLGKVDNHPLARANTASTSSTTTVAQPPGTNKPSSTMEKGNVHDGVISSSSLESPTQNHRLATPGSLVLPVYRQYIHDRVSGNSYVPLVYRGLPDAGGARHYHSHVDNPTDCHNRPPHFLCYLPPCVRRCPGILEQNSCCEGVGKVGFHRYFKNHHMARRRILFVGFTFNLISLCLTIVASMAGSVNYTLLTHTSFTRGTAFVYNTTYTKNATTSLFNTTTKSPPITFNVGMRALARHDPNSVQLKEVIPNRFDNDNTEHVSSSLDDDVEDASDDEELVITLRRFCKNPAAAGGGSGFFHLKETLGSEICGECVSTSQSFVVSILINIGLIVRNMLSDITRMYPKYDLNCPKFSASLLATLSVILGLYTIFAYQGRCQRNLQTEFVSTDNVVDNENGTLWVTTYDIKVTFDWTNGPGLNCLIVATFLKLADAIVNYMVPTPTITRSPEERYRYELEFGTSLENGGHDDDGGSGGYKNNNNLGGDNTSDHNLIDRSRQHPQGPWAKPETNNDESKNLHNDDDEKDFKIYNTSTDDDDDNKNISLHSAPAVLCAKKDGSQDSLADLVQELPPAPVRTTPANRNDSTFVSALENALW